MALSPTSSRASSSSGGDSWTTVTKGSDTSRASVTAVAADPALTFTGVNGTVYIVELYLVLVAAAGGPNGDFKYTFGEDATVRGAFGGPYVADSESAAIVPALVQTGASTLSVGVVSTNRLTYALATYRSGGVAASVQWAQVTSDANATILKTGSLLRYRSIV